MSEQVIRTTTVINNPMGLHARPAELFARKANQFQATIEIVRSDQRVDAKSILHLLTLGAGQGTELVLEARGADAQQAIETLVLLVESDFADEQELSQEQAG